MTAWMLVADSRKARIFEHGRARGEFHEVTDLVHPIEEKRLHGDAQRGMFSGMKGERHGMEPPRSPADNAMHAFAAEVAEFLRREYNAHHFSEITLAAPPDFLGALRAEIGDDLKKAVVHSIDKNLLACATEELERYFTQARLH